MFKWLALFAALGLAPAQAQNFTMPPPAGVVVAGFNVVASCAGQAILTTKPAFGTIDTTGALCVNATVSASVTGFTPNGNFATLTSTASSADAALPTGVTVLLQNTGTSAVSCNLTIGAGSSAASKIVIQNGSTEGVVVGSNTHYSCINQAGDAASNVVVAAGGAGLSTTFGGGGGGGGGGGAVTIADGASVTLGAKADAACGTSTGTCSEIALLKYLLSVGIAVTNANANGQATAANSSPVVAPVLTVAGAAVVKGGVPVVNGGSNYLAVAASQTATVLQTSTGAAGDYLSHCVIYPASTSPGVVTVFDSTNTAANSAILFAGGATSLSNLSPIPVPVGANSINGAWKVTTGTNVSVVCYGKFS